MVADTADAIVVAPATAHWLGAMANGLAGDVVTATCLATTARSSSPRRWTARCTRIRRPAANVARLRDGFGYRIVEPETGPLASGQSGVGRLAEPAAIVDAVVAGGRRPPDPRAATPASAAAADLAPCARRTSPGRHVVVTAGGTAEPIDPVRFIGNRSTGKMGVAVAAGRARPRGAA